MTTQYTPILKIALPVTGELSGTWGDVVNDNITSMFEQAIAGLATISTWSANSHTLTTANGTTSESRCAMLVAADGAGLAAAGEIICPAASKLYVLKNGSSYALTLKTAGGTGVAVAAGETAFLFCDGTNVNACVTTIINGRITGNLTVDGNATINGNTTLGNATSDTITATARFASDLVPSTDNARDLGSSANSWRSLWIDGTATMALVAISGGTIDGVSIGATTPATIINVDNLSLNGNTISSTDTNGNIVLAPNGTGDVQLDADTVRVGDSGAAATLTSNGAGALTVTTGGAANLTLSTNNGTNSGTIVINNGATGTIAITPDTTGDVHLVTDTVRIGDPNTDAYLTTNGTGNLNLTTNEGNNSGTIQIAQGANGNITLTPNGTGLVSIPSMTLSGGTANGVAYLNGSKVLTTGSALTFNGADFQIGGGASGAIATINGAATGGSLRGQRSGTNHWFIGDTASGLGSGSGLLNYVYGNDPFIWYNGGTNTEQMRLTSTGLGIGTSSPTDKLHVIGLARINTGTYAAGYGLTFQANSETSRTYQMGMVTGGNFAIYDSAAAATRVTLDSFGNLGLGVTPSAWATSGNIIKAFEGFGGSFLASQSGLAASFVGTGCYYDGSVWRYKATGTVPSYALQFGGAHSWFTAPSGTAGNAISFTQAMTLTAAGALAVGYTSVGNGSAVFQDSLGIGTISPQINSSGRTVHIHSSTNGHWSLLHTTTNETGAGGGNGTIFGQIGVDGYVFNYEVGDLIFGTSSTARARIDSSGNLLLGRTSPQSGIASDTVGISLFGSGSSAPGVGVFVRNTGAPLYANNKASSGDLVILYCNNANVGIISSNGSTTTYGTTSDYRLKESVQPMTGALARVAALKPVTYTWKNTGQQDEGFIAHELQEVCPSAVSGEKDAVNEDGSIKPQSIDTSFLVATLTAAIQEQQAIIEQLKARLDAANL